MFLELVATIVAGIGAAGLALLAGRATGGRLPRWTAPVAAGLAMLTVAIVNESTWGGRTMAGLPDGVVVVDEVQRTAWWRPWTYVAPQTVRLVAADTASVRTNPRTPGTVLADLYLFSRWQPTARVPQLIDCTAGRRADVTAATLADPVAADWSDAGVLLVAAICGEGESGA